MPRTVFIHWLEDHAASFGAPVRGSVEVSGLRTQGDGFVLATNSGAIEAANVVVATGTYQSERVPAEAASLPAAIHQVHAGQYRNPQSLPEGAVLVVGSAQSGCQIAEEIQLSGRQVYLSTGKAGRLPRRYRGRDANWWQDRMGLLDRTPDMLESPSHRFRGDPHLTGTGGGRTLNLHSFARMGIQLLGKFAGADGSALRFGDDLAANLSYADDYAQKFLASVDAYILREGVNAPAADDCNSDFGGPHRAPAPESPGAIDLRSVPIRSVVWATGFKFDFSWIEAPCRDSSDYPVSDRGVSAIPGLYFLGLNWLYKRKSGILCGVGDDAEYLAPIIARRVHGGGGGNGR
jgi:putative flavoprotein involved in K+ transport